MYLLAKHFNITYVFVLKIKKNNQKKDNTFKCNEDNIEGSGWVIRTHCTSSGWILVGVSSLCWSGSINRSSRKGWRSRI